MVLYYIGAYTYNVRVQEHVNEYNIILLHCLTAQSALDFSYKKYLCVLPLNAEKD